uniref:Branched-chain-amino-acid aminotransferase n=1 Tax=Eucampia antarctica TaxID=49252 RepID=A0A7S2S5Y2_9STRA|mmetsp:Transcript_31284/g.30131  ORF Transcript_31284/g.30131 Transcript_31284/m.30131 type:complete len:417 (+) Transcript_31284:61-1311(+)|eukprot:CAMPEP_0197834076 /NCGR_PEP_ID=MMETSP1437-20131217/21111_1 /TAXON_ID=49252 ORGANISM="Eucampia antarctica, Strain CCMP1452" /NCGR_SAMPLE_ID=MMETSP1437 /ASSEMBLY_ACC=CAM_ASM_001096 /LENGTH=416 /DNA_ID=CAMNT_0043438501 /DNA_START=55 /DNA_END=1305 /DNA_ORIENTATION=+
MATLQSTGPLPPEPKSGIDFESLPWNLNEPESHSYVHLTTKSVWDESHYNPSNDSGTVVSSIRPYFGSGSLPIYPACTSLNYGTTIWEGLKCYRAANGHAVIFRPNMNWKRFCNGADAMCLPPPSLELFLRALQTAVRGNATLIPPFGDGMKLYIRPMLLGSGQQLGLYPSSEFSLLFYVSPTGNYFKGKTAGGLILHLETVRSRASRGGMGSVKCSGNYASTLKPLQDAKAEGFNDNLYLELETYQPDKLEDAIVQELSAANIFLVLKSGEIITPSLERGTILPGVTRDSVLVLAQAYADELKESMVQSTGDPNVTVTVSERSVRVSDFKNAAEVFITGTAAEVVPVQSISTGTMDKDSFKAEFPSGKIYPGGPVTAKLLLILREVMYGKRSCEATKGWLADPFTSAEEFRSAFM